MKVLMTGATGLIGKELGKALVSRGYEIFVISRDAVKAREQLPFPCEIIEGDLVDGPITNNAHLRMVDVVINLAGEPIGSGRWNEARKRRIYESRIFGTRHLIKSLSTPPRIFFNASAVGYYGPQGDKEISEDSSAGEDFLAQVCQDWEEELLSFSYAEASSATRIVALRTGMVLAAQGGALDKLRTFFRSGLGGVLGDGKQWMSWIHIDDVVGLVMHILDNNAIHGPVNLVSPNPVTNEEFTKTMASVLGAGFTPRIPAFALWTSLGEMATLMLSSQRAVPRSALQSGYKFLYPELKSALVNIFNSEKEDIFVSEQFLPWSPEKVFSFFCNIDNFQKITPPSLEFDILSDPMDKIELGCKLAYRLKVHGISVKWRAVVEEWNPPFYFTEVQSEGPYNLWRHGHEFRPLAEGTLMIDRVHYSLPMGYFGNLVGGALVRSEIERIFQFRRDSLIKNLQQESWVNHERIL